MVRVVACDPKGPSSIPAKSKFFSILRKSSIRLKFAMYGAKSVLFLGGGDLIHQFLLDCSYEIIFRAKHLILRQIFLPLSE